MMDIQNSSCIAGINVQNLQKHYQENIVLNDISFVVEAGQSLSIIGPSGCGKSTLLSLLAHIAKDYNGKITFITKSGNDFFQENKRFPRVSYVLQDYGLFPWKRADENLALPLLLLGLSKEEREFKVNQMFCELGLQGMEKRFPSELSGGQKQRLALGRALISDPEIILLDEPLSSVDAINREYLQNVILELWKKHTFTFVLVTHSVSEAVYLGKNILALEKYSEDKKIQYTHFENPYFGENTMREKPEFFELCKKIQKAIVL